MEYIGPRESSPSTVYRSTITGSASLSAISHQQMSSTASRREKMKSSKTVVSEPDDEEFMCYLNTYSV
jgi:hypothetical protein